MASFATTWRALNLWPLFSTARSRPAWPLAGAAVVLAVLIPAAAWSLLAVVVGYFAMMTALSVHITRSRTWTLLADHDGDAVIGFRIWHHEGRVQLILDSHLARRRGAGQGRRLRERLTRPFAEVLNSRPETVVRFRAQNARLAAAYHQELKDALPEIEGWVHHLEGWDGTVRRGVG